MKILALLLLLGLYSTCMQGENWTNEHSGEDFWYVGDFNGDGKDDVLRYVPGHGADVLTSNGSAFEAKGRWTADGRGNHRWYVGDFNGDKRTDIFRYIEGHGIDVYFSSGHNFQPQGRWTEDGCGDDKWYVGDFNGDGKDDIFQYVIGRGIEVYISNGKKFVPKGRWTADGKGSHHWYVGDFNGDQKADIFRYVIGRGIEVYFSSGTSFQPQGRWTADGCGDDYWYIGDFNADGKDDIFRYIIGHGIDVYFSSERSFQPQGRWSEDGRGNHSWYVGKFDEDQKSDIFRYITRNPGADVYISSGRQFVNEKPVDPRPTVVFDFDTDSCYPDRAILENGEMNGGLRPRGNIVGKCRSKKQLAEAHTYVRRAEKTSEGVRYEVHMFALYFEKDQAVNFAGGGHRHDWEFALLWLKDGKLTHASVSAHGKVTTRPIGEVPQEEENMIKVVYHKDGLATHAFRFAKIGEKAENHFGEWVTPKIMDWHSMVHPILTNRELQRKFNMHNFGKANCSFNDVHFLKEIKKSPPPGYPWN